MTRIYVGGIATDCRERDLDRFFRNYGRIRDILIKNGYAFVEFEDNRDADDAVYEMNGRELLGSRVSVEHARGIPRRGDSHRDRGRQHSWNDRRGNRGGGGYGPPSDSRYGPPMRTPYRVLVENLSSRISWQDLKDYMRKEADVTFADAHRHARNVGIVEFASHSDMQRALDRLDDTELMGRRIKLIDDYNKKSRSRSRRRRSRSRSRSRSRRHRSYSSSRSRSRSRRRSRSRSRSDRKSSKRSHSRSRSRSRSKDSKRSRSRSRSKSEAKDIDRRSSKSRSRTPEQKDTKNAENGVEKRSSLSPEKSQNGKRAASKSRSRSRSKSRSRSIDRKSDSNRSPPSKKRRTSSRSPSRSRSRSASRSKSRSRSRSNDRDSRDDRSRSRSASRSRSRSGDRNGSDRDD